MNQLMAVPNPDANGADPVSRDLAAMIAWARSQHSRMGYFAALYTHVSAAIQKTCSDGGFVRPDLLLRVNETFFARYHAAFDARRQGAPTTGPWTAAFDATQLDRLCVVQHLLLGMNAHINYDLPIAVATALDAEELTEFATDFNTMNVLLGSLLHDVSTDLAVVWPLLKWINRFGSGAEDVTIEFSMKLARAHAWRSALRLSPLCGEARAQAIAHLDRVAVGLARDVAHPRGVSRFVAVAVHLGERGSVDDIITDMLS